MNKKNMLKVICVLVLSISLAGCAMDAQPKSDEEGTNSGLASETSTEQSSDEQEASKSETPDVEEKDTLIETPYGSLCFPSQWDEFLKVEQTKENETVVVSFSAEIKDEQFPLFTISIGNGEGEPAGTISDADGTQHDVYVHVEEIQESEALSESEQKRLYVMQEDINYLLDNLK